MALPSLNADCYVTVEEADEYFSSRLNADIWITLSAELKNKALVTAGKKIERLPFIGYKRNPKQKLHFPIAGMDYVPVQVKEAVFEEALFLLQNEEAETAVQSLSLGDASITYKDAGLNNVCKNSRELLNGFLKVGFDINQSVYLEKW